MTRMCRARDAPWRLYFISRSAFAIVSSVVCRMTVRYAARSFREYHNYVDWASVGELHDGFICCREIFMPRLKNNNKIYARLSNTMQWGESKEGGREEVEYKTEK